MMCCQHIFQERLHLFHGGIAVASNAGYQAGRPQYQYSRRKVDDDIVDVDAGDAFKFICPAVSFRILFCLAIRKGLDMR